MTRAGLHIFKCEACGQIKELEAGIRTIYCCAQLMVEVPEAEEEQGPTLRLRPKE